MTSETTQSPQLITIREFCSRYSIGRTKVYELLNAGQIEAKKIGTSTLITSASVDIWLAGLPAYAA